MFFLPAPNMKGNEEQKEGADWIDGKLIFPMASLSPKPKIPLIWLYVTHF